VVNINDNIPVWILQLVFWFLVMLSVKSSKNKYMLLETMQLDKNTEVQTTTVVCLCTLLSFDVEEFIVMSMMVTVQVDTLNPITCD
jgi:hypothetical protein